MTHVPTGKLIDTGPVTRGPSYENHSLTTIPNGTTCEGVFDFNTGNKGDLPFKKGDTLVVIQRTRDPNWYRAQNSKGESGMVPLNYITQSNKAAPAVRHKEVKLTAMPWFHGKITRSDAEDLLTPRKDGLFLVRESTNYPGDYTMCVSFAGEVEHYRVIFKDNKVTIDEEEYFENLTKLVEHYERDADGLVCTLTQPLIKKGGHEYSVDTEEFRKSGWAINFTDLKLGTILGKGDFGDVYEGTYKDQKVAVKSVKDRSKAAQAFLAEASVMTQLHHKNLIKLLGVVIPQTMSNDPIYVVLEFMTKGAMLEYLRSRGRALVTSNDLWKFAKDIALGMEYLENKQLVHRDLAARNILISEECVAKVSDFGLARDASFNLQGGKFPVKWTAPEALKEGKFSNKSDVWSYGITLWEMWSFGRVPYPRVPLKDLLAKVQSGYRMDCPERCDKIVYQLMLKCWLKDVNERLSFKQIVHELDVIKPKLLPAINP
uniref:tyrosine-protein kinase CSK n=1 Tax=Ciona intestinalis TaxID=7719 RepID=UPI000180C03D|nr:tyrosine-protein kinase CSK [Ciona intestinalis]|eukprot:XP_009861279.1 tyrosine-protein kinase CSK [Ciona intestinalis]